MRRDRYWEAGLIVFLTVAAILLFYDTVFASRTAIAFLGRLFHAMAPILFGAMVAYLLSPLVDLFEQKLLLPLVKRTGFKGKNLSRCLRAGSLLLTWILIGVAGYLLLSVLVPELYRSILQLVSNVENYYNVVTGWIQHFLENNPTVETWVTAQMNHAFEAGKRWVENEALPRVWTVMIMATGGLATLVNLLKTLLVGFIVSVYLLATKESCAAYSRRLVCGLFPAHAADWIFRGTRKVDEIFSGFVRGKLLDSLIIGVICFFGCSLLKFPYTPLVSVIIGVTNIIPFFGPFLGAIPSIFLILLDSPVQALYFAVFVLALQQVDGNIIGPAILGGNTGLSSLWVIIAILVGGSFFGVAGMFFGVPVFACLYSAVNFFIDLRLKKKHLPVEIDAYRTDGPSPANQPPESGGGKP